MKRKMTLKKAIEILDGPAYLSAVSNHNKAAEIAYGKIEEASEVVVEYIKSLQS